MSLKVIKAGMLDSIQDPGRFGYRQYGINPTGVMDSYASRTANVLAGNAMEDAVIEMHFPSSVFLFNSPAVIALTGADFSATINDQFIPNNTAIRVNENSILRFTNPVRGARCYLAVAGGFELSKWLDSYSTHLKAMAGGLHGNRLIKDDVLAFRNTSFKYSGLRKPPTVRALEDDSYEIYVLPGNEWNRLSEENKDVFLKNEFLISRQSDRMGYRLTGNRIYAREKMELVSSPVCFGTIQLLPDGQLIILMADHQTTGGYPRIAVAISVHHSRLAQKKPGDFISFKLVDISTAEKLLFEQDDALTMMQMEINNNDL